MEQPDGISQFDRENRAFSEALGLPPDQRHAFLKNLGRSDPDLQGIVERMIARHERLGNFLETPLTGGDGAEWELSSGDLLNGRFLILEPLGRGGMGEVYRASCSEVRDVVALKTIRAEWRDNESMVERFRAEIRLARRIAHPNVCPIFDLFIVRHPISGNLAFFTMKYLDGDTLADRMKAGPLSKAATLRLTRGIALGLDAAHAEGVIHRDLKPANIIIVSDQKGAERAVITDFGLARLDAGRSTGDETSRRVFEGSLNYMAPEQFRNEPATASADIYSLGVILFEMAAGKRPFKNETDFGIALRKCTEDAPLLSTVAGSEWREWDRPLAEVLSRDPRRRPVSAIALFRELESENPRPETLFTRNISRRAWATAACGALAVSSFWALRRYIGTRSVPPPGAPTLMLTPVQAFAGDQNARSIDVLLHTQLEQSSHLRLLGVSQMQNAWNRISGKPAHLPDLWDRRSARDVALRESANLLLFGSLSRVSDQYLLDLEIEFLASNRERPVRVESKSFRAENEQSLIPLTLDAVDWIRLTSGESRQEIDAHAADPEDLTTNNWHALTEYVRAVRAFQLSPQGAGADEAVNRLKRALDLDPNFALAAARLADYLVASGREDEGLKYHQIAFDLIGKLDLTDRESLRIQGMFFQDTGQDKKAIDVFSMWATTYPQDAPPLFYKTYSLLRTQQWLEAEGAQDRALELDPHYYSLFTSRCVLRLMRNQLDEAERECRRADALNPRDWTHQLQGAILFGRGDLPAVRHLLERMQQEDSPSFQWLGMALEACLDGEGARWKDTEDILESAISFALKRGLSAQQFMGRILLAEAFLRQGRKREVTGICETLLASTPGPRSSMQVGCILARAGEVIQAETLLAPQPDPARRELAYLATPVFEHWRTRLRAEIAMARGDGRRAVTLLESAPPNAIINVWPEYLFRASLAANDLNRARTLATDLLTNPGRYWLQAHYAGIGFFWEAVEAGRRIQLIPEKLMSTDFASKLFQRR